MDGAGGEASISAGGRVAARVAAWLAVAGVLAQICYPLLDGTPLALATVLSVALLAAAAVAHAGALLGSRAALAVLVAAAGIGLAAEALGTGTGFPFGAYSYADDGRLGPHLLGVPVVVPLAWTMLSYPALLLARRLTAHRAARAALGAGTLTGWDLFLDPQMVAAGHWTWLHPSPALPGVPDVPLTNFAGWLLVGAVMVGVLDRVLPERPLPAAVLAVPAGVLAWTWLGSALGNVAFFDRPWVALYGLLGMGLFVAPFLLNLLRESRSHHEVTR